MPRNTTKLSLVSQTGDLLVAPHSVEEDSREFTPEHIDHIVRSIALEGSGVVGHLWFGYSITDHFQNPIGCEMVRANSRREADRMVRRKYGLDACIEFMGDGHGPKKGGRL